MRPLKILYVVHGYKPAYRIGGPITSVAAVAEGLAKRGNEVTVFTTNSDLDELLSVPVNSPVDVDGVQVYYFEFTEALKRYLPGISYVSRANNFLYSEAMKHTMTRTIGLFDLVHTHLPFIYPTILAGRLSHRAQIPLFYHQRGVFDPARLRFRSFKKAVYLNLIEKPILRKATTLFALTEAEVESYRLLGLRVPCAIVPNGIDAAQFGRRSSEAMLAEFGIQQDDQVILYLSRIHPTKGPERLLQAFIKIASRNPKSKLVLAGPDEFGLGSKIRSVAQRANLQNRVILPGMISGQKKISLLSRADLFCLPSDAEGFSIAILEALASRTPVIISPGCHFEAVERAGAGLIVDTTPEAIAKALHELLGNPARLQMMGLNARRLVEDHYSWPLLVERTEGVYREGLVRFSAAQKR